MKHPIIALLRVSNMAALIIWAVEILISQLTTPRECVAWLLVCVLGLGVDFVLARLGEALTATPWRSQGRTSTTQQRTRR